MAGIDADTDRKRGRFTEGVAPQVQSPVHQMDHVGQADRVDVEDCRGIGIRAHFRRIAGNQQEVPQAEGGAAEEVGMHAQQIAVPAAVVEHRLDSDALLEQHSDGDRTHAILRARPVRDVHGIDARFLDRVDSGDHGLRIRPFGRRNFDGGDELAVCDLAAPVGPFLQSHRLASGISRLRRILLDDDERAPR